MPHKFCNSKYLFVISCLFHRFVCLFAYFCPSFVFFLFLRPLGCETAPEPSPRCDLCKINSLRHLSSAHRDPPMTTAYAYLSFAPALLLSLPTPSKVRTKDIMTYKDKSADGEWRLLDYITSKRIHLPRFYQMRVLGGPYSSIPQQTITWCGAW